MSTDTSPAGADASAGFAFRLDHRPAPQGSYRPVPHKNKTTGAYTGKFHFKASSAGLKEYRSSLGWVVQGGRRGVVLDEPVGVIIRWQFRAPKKSIAGARCPDTGTVWPATRSTGDVDKLTRAVLDALTIGHAIADDSRVVALDALMSYGESEDPLWEGSTSVRVIPIAEYMKIRV